MPVGESVLSRKGRQEVSKVALRSKRMRIEITPVSCHEEVTGDFYEGCFCAPTGIVHQGCYWWDGSEVKRQQFFGNCEN